MQNDVPRHPGGKPKRLDQMSNAERRAEQKRSLAELRRRVIAARKAVEKERS